MAVQDGRVEQLEPELDPRDVEITRLRAELADLRAQARRITNHTYEGPGACHARFFGETCGGDKTDHELIDEEA